MTEAKMQQEPTYAPGTFCWVELATSDSAAAKKFYTELFSWTTQDSPMGPDMVYTTLKLDGKDVGGLFQLTPEMTTQGVPPNWLSYVSVTSADDAAAKAKDAGATLMKEPFDVSTIGRMAVVQDPTGAVFALWQAGTNQGAGVVGVPNSFCWNELGTSDPARAADFYTTTFGWTKNVMPMGEMGDYTMFMNGEKPAGGMYQLPADMATVPPNWMVYFAVADCDAAAEKAGSLGATTMVPPTDIPTIGRFSILMDPQGAAFALIKLEYPEA